MIVDLLLALLVAILLAALLAWPLGRRGPGPLGGVLFFFVILFLAAWAGGVWLTPIEPSLYGVPWLSFLLVGLVLALILAAATPPARPPAEPPVTRGEAEPGPAEVAVVSLGALFYIALFVLIAAVGIYYIIEML